MNPEQNTQPILPDVQVQPQAEIPSINVCPACHSPIQDEAFFCPNCGKKIKDPAPSTTIEAQIKIYLICIFAPPFGLIPGIKYVLSHDHKTRMIGVIAILLTAISLGLTILGTMQLVNTLNKQLNSQLDLQGL